MQKQHHLPTDPSLLAERWEWLQAEQARYWAEPNQAGDQIAATQVLFEQVQQEAPSDFGVALAAHLGHLLDDDIQGYKTAPVLAIGLGWTELGLGLPYRIYMLARICRCHAYRGEGEQAALLLARLSELNVETTATLEDSAHYERALAACHNLKQDTGREIECLQAAAQLYQRAEYKGEWANIHTLIALGYLRLGDIERRLASSQTAVDLSIQQGRWVEACNALTGVVEACLMLGDASRAQLAAATASSFLPRLSAAVRKFLEPEVLAAQAKCCAAHQDFADAVLLMRQCIASAIPKLTTNGQHARRLRDLAPWLVRTGEGGEALLALDQAHALELADIEKSTQKSLTQALENAELQHALAEREVAQAHAKALEVRNQALSESLQLQRELQAELIASSRLASLGSLLAGMSHELNTPLGVALTALSSLVARGQALDQRVHAGAISRLGLLADVAAVIEGGALSQANVERAIGLIATYKDLAGEWPEAAAELAATQPLHVLVRAAWEQALAPDRGLSLELNIPEHLSVPPDALADVLLQLFQNVARHAYEPGQPGLVQVSAGRRGHQLWLNVQDHGRGIAADLLPRVFDPYVSTQFGQGRSGLGLFKAQAQVSKGLKGRLSVKSASGQGACFEIEWLQLELQPAPL